MVITFRLCNLGTQTFALYNINSLVFKTDVQSVYSAYGLSPYITDMFRL